MASLPFCGVARCLKAAQLHRPRKQAATKALKTKMMSTSLQRRSVCVPLLPRRCSFSIGSSTFARCGRLRIASLLITLSLLVIFAPALVGRQQRTRSKPAMRRQTEQQARPLLPPTRRRGTVLNNPRLPVVPTQFLNQPHQLYVSN